jgi:hypothetical protein
MRVIKKVILLFSILVLKVSAQTDTLPLSKNNSKYIELSFFDVAPKENHVLITWATTFENNNAYFTIEKSRDGRKYSKIIDVPGSGNSKMYKEYAETDYQPYTGNSFYRLRITDYNGNVKHFPTTGVIFDGKKETKAYPTQAEMTMLETAELKEVKNEEVLVLLQDAEGIDYTAKLLITKENEQLFAEDVSRNTPPGIYIVLSSSDGSIYSHKIIVK